MEEVAHGHAAPLAFEHNFSTISSTVEDDIQNRIRSILVSHNECRPSKTPSPSPKRKYLLHHSGEDRIGNTATPPKIHPVNVTKAAAALARLQSSQSDMVATRLDVHAMQPQDTVNGPRRRPSQPAMGDERPHCLDGSWLPLLSGLNQKAEETKLGREGSEYTQLKPNKSIAAPSTPNRIPRYSLRVVTPETSQVRNPQLRPNAHHVPGSYRTESDVAAAKGYKRTVTPLGDSGPETSEGYYSTTVESSLAARVALEKATGHGASTPLHQSECAAEDTALAPKTSKKRSPYTLLMSPSGGSGISQAAEPVLTVGMDHGRSHTEVDTDYPQPPQMGLQPPKAPSRASSLRTIHLEAEEENGSATLPLLGKTSSPPRYPVSDDAPRLSPISRALSMLSEMSGRSRLKRGSSISTTTGQKHSSIAKPSEIRPAGSSPSATSATQSENQENEQSLPWIQQFVGKRSANARRGSNLTARTNYRHNRAAADPERVRSRTLPTEGNWGTESIDAASFLRTQQDNSQSFSKAIFDLENLLKEALSMAGKVASRENSEAAPMLATDTSRKEHRQPQSTEAENGSDESDSSAGNDEHDHQKPGVRGQIVIAEPASEARYHGHFRKVRDATPYPSATRHQSTMLPQDDKPSDVQPEVKAINQSAAPVASGLYSESPTQKKVRDPQSFIANDWAFVQKPKQLPPSLPQEPPSSQVPDKEQHSFLVRGLSDQQRPPVVQPRVSSMKLHGRQAPKVGRIGANEQHAVSSGSSESDGVPYVADFKNDGLQYHPVFREAMVDDTKRNTKPNSKPTVPREDTIASRQDKEILIERTPRPVPSSAQQDYSLKSRHHFSIREPRGFSLSRSHRRAPIARDWTAGRKRFIATVTCITTALMGLIIGIYAGEVPAIQYALADEHHYTVLGNVVFFLGLAFTTIMLWPLPLLHGRKPYTLAALIILLPLQFPQALAVNSSRSPSVASYRVGVLLPRAFSGLVMGFANINFKTTLLDLFGASLQSGNPHEEMVNENDVRRHGGGIGTWLGIWTWCSIMSIGVGFLIGAGIISDLNVSWGYWITIILNAAVLLLNVMVPEVRRSPYRRSMAEVRNGTDVSRRIARGEIKMHLESTGPKYWYEEVIAGQVLCMRMLKQPGFLVLALYQGWIYGQVVMVIMVWPSFF